MAGYAQGRQWGFYSVNDVRRELGEDTIGPEGDVYLVPVNMTSATLVANPPTEKVDPEDASITRTAVFERLFRDAVGRLTTRQTAQRDLQTVRQVFEPLLSTLAEVCSDAAKRSTNAPQWSFDSQKAITDTLQKLSERAGTWKAEDADTIAQQELQRCSKALSLTAHRSIAEFAALKGLTHA
jgi:hypothetical protein